MSKAAFLKDVTYLAFTAYGGPQAHIAMMLDYLVAKKNYLTEEELIELNALCQMLPGPTSTQTITSIGYKIGGPPLAFLTLLIWAFPAVVGMTALSFLYGFLSKNNIGTEFLRFIGPLAVGFIVVAAYKIGKKVVKDATTGVLFLLSATIACFFRDPWVFPVILIVGGLITYLVGTKSAASQPFRVKPPWQYLIAFIAFFVLAEVLAYTVEGRMFVLFESFYRYGSLIFGGGQVLIPFIQGDLVETKQFLTSEEFLTGYGMVQGFPGPVFSFSAYAGGMAMADASIPMHVLASAISALAIFLPGTLLIFFIYPIWEDLKQLQSIRLAMAGINATAAGLVAAAAIILLLTIGLSVEHILIVLTTAALLIFTKLQSPILVVIALVAGVILQVFF